MNTNGSPKYRIGVVINTTFKPARDVHLGIVNYILSGGIGTPLLFVAGNGTSPANVKTFAENRIDGMIFCGVRQRIVREFLRLMPDHPPVVLSTHAILPEEDWELLGCGGAVMLDNESIGVKAADFFVDHGLRHFAFFASNVCRERIAGAIWCDAFRRRIQEKLGTEATFSQYVTGVVADNDDYWELGNGESEKWLGELPHPCGVLVNEDREAANMLAICKNLGIRVPDDLEILGVNNSHGFCEQAQPAISSLAPDYAKGAVEAVDMLTALIADPKLPRDRRRVWVPSCAIIERGSTSSGDFGHVVARAREFIRRNACEGIGVPDVVAQVGVSRRLLEKRIREATGGSVLDMIQKVRLENVCRLLANTTLPISAVTTNSGYEPTSNLGHLFRRTYGMSMREFRARHAAGEAGTGAAT